MQAAEITAEGASSSVSKTEVPRHVAIIMDGNGRWAKARGLARTEGHRAGAKSVRCVIEQCRKHGVRYLSLFSFSSENWKRTPQEVAGLMAMFAEHLDSELRNQELLHGGVRLRAIGNLERLPLAVRLALKKVTDLTKSNTELDLVLALSYSGRDDILQASRNLAEKVRAGLITADDINEESFNAELWTAGMPEPDVLIRTGGEMRISNFMLWQSAYSEIISVPEFWPDFDESVFLRCLKEYQGRERRFGLTSEQLSRKD